MDQLSALAPRINALTQRYEATRRAYLKAQQQRDQAVYQGTVAKEAQTAAQTIAATIQEQAHLQIATVVSQCLAAVFEEEAYTFRIQFEEKRGKTEARLVFERDGLELDPLASTGGGPVDVAAFALRLVVLALSRPSQRKVLFLDEPFRYVSREYLPRVRTMLEAVAQQFHTQIVMVTHQQGLRTGTIVEIGEV